MEITHNLGTIEMSTKASTLKPVDMQIGVQGNGIKHWYTEESMEGGGLNTLHLLLDDGREVTFSTKNGTNGTNGLGILKITPIKRERDTQVVITTTDGNALYFVVPDGAKGDQGEKGLTDEEHKQLMNEIQSAHDAATEANNAATEASRISSAAVQKVDDTIDKLNSKTEELTTEVNKAISDANEASKAANSAALAADNASIGVQTFIDNASIEVVNVVRNANEATNRANVSADNSEEQQNNLSVLIRNVQEETAKIDPAISQMQATFEASEAARDAAFESNEATRDAANQAALDAASTLADLGRKVDEIVGGIDKIPVYSTANNITAAYDVNSSNTNGASYSWLQWNPLSYDVELTELHNNTNIPSGKTLVFAILNSAKAVVSLHNFTTTKSGETQDISSMHLVVPKDYYCAVQSVATDGTLLIKFGTSSDTENNMYFTSKGNLAVGTQFNQKNNWKTGYYLTYKYASEYLNTKDVIQDISQKFYSGEIDNYEFIKAKACVFSHGKNYINPTVIIKNYGVDGYYRCGYISTKQYSCTIAELELGKDFFVSGYKRVWAGQNICNCFALLVKNGDDYRNLKDTDLVSDSNWLIAAKTSGWKVSEESGYTGNIYIANVPEDKLISTPPKEELVNIDKLYVAINTSFPSQQPEAPIFATLQLEQGTNATVFEPYNPNETLKSVFDAPLEIKTSGEDTTVHYDTGKSIFGFFGDSITDPRNQSESIHTYVPYLVDVAKINAYNNFGASGNNVQDMYHNIKNNINSSYTGISIQIGTNNYAPDGDVDKDAPDIGVDNLTFPYSYEDTTKTIATATLNSVDDYFDKLFADTFIGWYMKAIAYIQYKNPKCRVFLITPPIQQGRTKVRDMYVFREAIQKIATKMGVEFIDALGCAGMNYQTFYKYTQDGTHLTDEGAKKWGTYIGNQIKRLYYTPE